MFLISAIEIKVKCLVYCYKMYNNLNQLNQLKLWLKKVTLKVVPGTWSWNSFTFSGFPCLSLIWELLPCLNGSHLSHLVVVSCSLLKENVGEVILKEMGEGQWGFTGGKTVIKLCCIRGESIFNKKQVHNLRSCVKYRGWKWMHFGNWAITLIPNTHSQ